MIIVSVSVIIFVISCKFPPFKCLHMFKPKNGHSENILCQKSHGKNARKSVNSVCPLDDYPASAKLALDSAPFPSIN